MKRKTAQWVRKAEADVKGARTLAGVRPRLHDLICFHCQQAAEKYLKAALQEIGLPITRTHDLDDLLNDLRPHVPPVRRLRRGVLFLTQFAVDYRYPGEAASSRQADAALRWTEAVRATIRAHFRLKV
jgi:HEPN domain-containing protein